MSEHRRRFRIRTNASPSYRSPNVGLSTLGIASFGRACLKFQPAAVDIHPAVDGGRKEDESNGDAHRRRPDERRERRRDGSHRVQRRVVERLPVARVHIEVGEHTADESAQQGCRGESGRVQRKRGGECKPHERMRRKHHTPERRRFVDMRPSAAVYTHDTVIRGWRYRG
ncbi:MAG: hypothetical protein ACI8UR_001420 [Natronomonas sp.]|jgi:hypothetical protein